MATPDPAPRPYATSDKIGEDFEGRDPFRRIILTDEAQGVQRIGPIKAKSKHYVFQMILMRPLTRALFVVAFAAAAIVLADSSEPVRAQSNFDGSWSVLIITDTGECDRAYRYGVRIVSGQFVYDGEAGVTFTGRVERNGQVAATVRRGQQRATGSGRLSGSSGAGIWRGISSTGVCGGRWEAERR
jgi:hypothetical protein